MALNWSEVATVTGILGLTGALLLYIIRGEMRGDVTRLDGRLNGHEKECAEFRKRIDERHAESTSRADQQHEELMEAIRDLQKNQVGFFHQRASDVKQ